jgi:hypothetical protein
MSKTQLKKIPINIKNIVHVRSKDWRVNLIHSALFILRSEQLKKERRSKLILISANQRSEHELW